MDTCQILHSVEQDDCIYENFLGVFPRDLIPKFRGDSSLIANTDTSNEEGTHWIAMFKENNLCEFFDSYGRPPFENSYVGFNVKYNEMKLQSDYSEVCGEYCLYFFVS